MKPRQRRAAVAVILVLFYALHGFVGSASASTPQSGQEGCDLTPTQRQYVKRVKTAMTSFPNTLDLEELESIVGESEGLTFEHAAPESEWLDAGRLLFCLELAHDLAIAAAQEELARLALEFCMLPDNYGFTPDCSEQQGAYNAARVHYLNVEWAFTATCT